MNEVAKVAYLKEDLYEFQCFYTGQGRSYFLDNDVENWVTAEEVFKQVDLFKNRWKCVLKKGTKFKCYLWGDKNEELWFDDVDYGIEEMCTEWAEKHLTPPENIGPTMSKVKMFDLLDGFYAWDHGCTDSGLSDEGMKEELKQMLVKFDNLEALLNEYVNAKLTNAKSRLAGYTIEDVKSFINWAEEFLGVTF